MHTPINSFIFPHTHTFTRFVSSISASCRGDGEVSLSDFEQNPPVACPSHPPGMCNRTYPCSLSSSPTPVLPLRSLLPPGLGINRWVMPAVLP